MSGCAIPVPIVSRSQASDLAPHFVDRAARGNVEIEAAGAQRLDRHGILGQPLGQQSFA